MEKLCSFENTCLALDQNSVLLLLAAIVEDDDEILLALAEALGQLVPAVGGPAHAALLLSR